MKLFGALLLVGVASLWLGVDDADAGNSAVGTAKLSGNKNMQAPSHVTPVAHNLDCQVTPPVSLPPAPITGSVVTIPSKVVITNNLPNTTVPAQLPITYVVAGHTYIAPDGTALKYGDKFLIDFNATVQMACTATASF